MKNNFKKTLLASVLSTLYPMIAVAGGAFEYNATVPDMAQLSDSEMSDEVGQALLAMAYTAPTGTGVGATNTDFGYYKVGLEAKMELNLNIRNLQLGCGGRNGPGKCDIDIQNLSLSGPADSKAVSGTPSVNGTPQWSVGRANTSAVLTNPFVEFAIKNPNTAATREVVGFRMSAEDILGHMTAGTVNDEVGGFSTGGGINAFSGYMKVGQTPVTSTTAPAMFGTSKDQAIAGKTRINFLLNFDRTVQADVNKMTVGAPGYTAPDNSNPNVYKYLGTPIWGINVPTQTVNFDFPITSVTGNRMSQLNLVVRDVPVGGLIGGQPRIAIGRDSGAIAMVLSSSVAGLVDSATFFMGADNANGTQAACATTYRAADCSYITNLKANVTVKQNFNLVHNLPISSGGYLSLQKEALRWPGSASAFTYNTSTGIYTDRADNYTPTDLEVMNYGDVAQPGWWMSFKDPLDFGALNPTTQIPMDDVLPQLATYITDYLSQNRIDIGASAAFGALFGAPIYKGLGDIQMAADARAIMVLENLLLDGNQKPVSNCFGGLKFC